MVFGRKKGFLSGWTSTRSVDTDDDPEFKARAQKLEVMHKTIAEIQFNIQVYAASWQAMCRASAAIAEGLAKLATGGGETSGDIGEDKKGAWSLNDVAHMYRSAQRTIDAGVRDPTHRVLEDTTLSETGALLSRFPPIFEKIARRKQLLAEVEAAKAKVRAAEAAKEKEKDSFAVVTGNEHRRRMSSALATATVVAAGVTAEVVADADRLEREREAMLVPQVSALVGCQAYFMRRSAAVLERLAEQLPFSALALCRLVRPAGATQTRREASSSALTSTASVDFSAVSLDSSASTAAPTFDGGGGSSRSSLLAASSPSPPPPHQHQESDDVPALLPADSVSLSSSAFTTFSPPPPPTASSTSSSSSPTALPVAATSREAATIIPPLPPRRDSGMAEEVAVEDWGATGRDDGDGGDDVEVSW